MYIYIYVCIYIYIYNDIHIYIYIYMYIPAKLDAHEQGQSKYVHKCIHLPKCVRTSRANPISRDFVVHI